MTVPWRGPWLRSLLQHGLRLASVIAILSASIAAAVEYQINFTDGTELRTSRVRQVGDAIQYEKFGGEASVAVDEVASVYVIEADGEVSWVMQPRREGSPPATTQGSAVPRPEVAPKGVPATPSSPPRLEAPQPTSVPPTVSADASGTKGGAAVAPEKPQAPATAPGARLANPTPPQLHAQDGSPPGGGASEPAPRPGKVILDPVEPLPKVLLRWAGAPIAALLALLAVAFVFRKKFRAADQGLPATEPLAATGEREVDFSEPSKSWETLVLAIEERDFDVYRLCWQQSYPDADLDLTFQKSLMNWKYYDYAVVKTEPHPKSKERFYLHIKRSTKFDRKDLEERVKRVSLLLTDGGWKFEEVPFGF